MLRRIRRDQVTLGMFVHRFEGSWLDHPFWLPRFHLTDAKDLARIRESSVTGVVIDEGRGLALDNADSGAAAEDGAAFVAGHDLLSPPLLPAQRRHGFAEERERAVALVKHSVREIKRLFAEAHAGEKVRLTAFAPLVAEVMASVARNPYALIAVTRLKKQDEYTYVHSLAVSALMTSFARHLDMPESEVFDYGVAGIVHDIGKIVVPNKILQKPGPLTDAEFALVRTHPEQGYRLLSRHAGASDVVLDVCRHHHERLDGSGYPFGLKDGQISRAARIAAICDVYDALTSNRSYKAAWKADEAIGRMYDWDGNFDRELLLGFMKTIGVYPPGLLVYLSSNRLAVTMPNDRRTSRPKVRVFFCARERTQLPLLDLVLDDDLGHDQIVREESPVDWGIAGWPLVAEQLMSGCVPKIVSVRPADTTSDRPAFDLADAP